MQAVADFYAGFALFMLIGSLIGLAVMLLQTVSARLHGAPPRRDDRALGPRPVATEPPAPLPADPGSVRQPE